MDVVVMVWIDIVVVLVVVVAIFSRLLVLDQ